MELKDAFNSMSFSVQNPNTLYVNNGIAAQYYDFAQRQLFTSGGSGYSMRPFSQLDREVLVELRDKLVALGGKPPELPVETPANPGLPQRQPLRP